jgi:hypothetical protein
VIEVRADDDRVLLALLAAPRADDVIGGVELLGSGFPELRLDGVEESRVPEIRPEPQRQEAFGDQRLGLLQAFGAEAPAFHLLRRELDVQLEDAIGGGRRDFAPRFRVLDPVRDEDVGLARDARVAVGGEGELLAVGREHRETVEALGEGDLLQASSIDVDLEDIEASAAGLAEVGCEEDGAAVGREVRREARRLEVRHLVRVSAVGVGDVDLELARADEVLLQQGLVFGRFLALAGTRSAPDELLAVGREERAAIVAQGFRDLLDAADRTHRVELGDVELEVTASVAREDDAPVVADGGFGVIGLGRAGLELDRVGAIGLGAVELEGVVDRPDVALAHVGIGRAALARGRVRVEDAFAAREVIGAGRARVALGDLLLVGAVRAHRPDLVAGRAGRALRALGLVAQVLSVEGPIGFRVRPARGQLADVLEMFFLGEIDLIERTVLRELRARARGERDDGKDDAGKQECEPFLHGPTLTGPGFPGNIFSSLRRREEGAERRRRSRRGSRPEPEARSCRRPCRG